MAYLLFIFAWLVACGGGGGGGGGGNTDNTADAPAGETPAATVGEVGAARFLDHATFGARLDDIGALAPASDFDAWFAAQARAQPCLESQRMAATVAAGTVAIQADRIEAWWYCAVRGDDQLRQRMAWALSQIFVVSDQSNALGGHADTLASYYDTLAQNALGNYRDLLGAVSRSVAMGLYLNMFGNRKADATLGTHADENFARELMQLFTVGLVRLNADGTPQRDANGRTVPTYSQTDVEQLARALTGWGFPGGNFVWGTPQWTVPMAPTDSYHDSGAKTIIGNTSIPAGLGADAELDMALDTLFHHPNVGPFIGRQLIQRLVTSNPSPAYVARVAAAFDDNGRGVRGDLLAVAKAILLDPEARTPGTGKLREPLLRVSQLWRLFDARAGDGLYDFFLPDAVFAQAPLRSPSVFNFYRPDYQPPGELTEARLAAPEMQILNESTVNSGGTALTYMGYLWRSSRGTSAPDDGSITLDFTPWEPLAADPDALVERLDLALTGAQSSAAVRSLIADYVAAIPADQVEKRIGDATDLLLHAPQAVVQR
jgi:uncharacterized protein (DUF1800 family)